jgi:hypothetical protein
LISFLGGDWLGYNLAAAGRGMVRKTGKLDIIANYVIVGVDSLNDKCYH